MKKAAAIPDAWDDNWETQADDAPTMAQKNQPPALTKAERLTQHAEANRKLWESADAPQTFHYLEASNNVPLTSAFKPQVKVLSRKPAAKPPVTGMARLAVHANSGQCLDDDDDDDGEDGDKSSSPLSAEQIRAKQKRDREEKQRRYDEARAKIFGQSAPSSRGSSPGTVTPPRLAEGRHHHHHSHHHGTTSGRGRGRGGAQRPNNADNRQQQLDLRRQNNQTRELYDPNHSAAASSSSRPDVAPTRRVPEGEATRGSPPKNELLQPIRAPRGPDGSGRGGFGFARRGSKKG